MCLKQRSIQRVIILNGEIKGLQTSPVIQLSISRLISKQKEKDGGGGIYTTERERDLLIVVKMWTCQSKSFLYSHFN